MGTPIGTPTGREVSAAAFQDARRSGAALTKRMQILSHLCAAGGGLTRQEISEQTEFALSVVCARVNELLGLGYIEVSGMQKPSVGNSRQLVAATNEGLCMFESEAAHDDQGGAA